MAGAQSPNVGTSTPLSFLSSRVAVYPITSVQDDVKIDSIRQPSSTRITSYANLRREKSFLHPGDLGCVLEAMRATIQLRIRNDVLQATDDDSEKENTERAIMMHAADLLVSLLLDSSSRWGGIRSLSAMGYVCMVLAADQIGDYGSLRQWSRCLVGHATPALFHSVSKRDCAQMYSQICVHLDWDFRSENWRLLQLLLLQPSPDYGPSGSFASDLKLIPNEHITRTRWKQSKIGAWLVTHLDPPPPLAVRVFSEPEMDEMLNEKLANAAALWWDRVFIWNEQDGARMALESIVSYCMQYATGVTPSVKGKENSLVFLCATRIEKLKVLLRLVAIKCLTPTSKKK